MIVLFVLMSIVGRCSPTPTPSSNSYSAATPYSLSHRTKSGYFAASTEADLDRVVSYSVQHDTAAIAQLVASDRAILLKGGMEVEIVERKNWGAIVKIRPRGQTLEIWTVMEAVD